jgi:hypothetical protein
VSQWRQFNLHAVDPVIKICAELAPRHHALYVPIGCTHQTYIGVPFTCFTKSAELPGFECAEQLGLTYQGQFADLIEKQGSPVGQFEQSHLVFDGSREGASDMAEKLAGEAFLRELGTVDGDKFLVGPTRLAVYQLGGHLLAAAGLSQDEHWKIGLGYGHHVVKYAHERGAAAAHHLFGIEAKVATMADGGDAFPHQNHLPRRIKDWRGMHGHIVGLVVLVVMTMHHLEGMPLIEGLPQRAFLMGVAGLVRVVGNLMTFTSDHRLFILAGIKFSIAFVGGDDPILRVNQTE